MRSIFVLALVLLLSLSSLPTAWSAVADERAELERKLHAFLGTTNERATHESFWTEDLIYTSSSGERFGKAEILAGFDEAPEDESMAGPTYGAEEVHLRMLGDLAVVTFRLTADENGERVGEYFNTGVFRKEDGEWKAFTWQATRIPDSAEE